MIYTLFPSLVAMILAVNLIINSGLLNFIISKLFFLTYISIPKEVIPLIFIRPISSSASLSYLNTILGRINIDGSIGILACLIYCSMDTTFYIISLYFGSVGIKKTKYCLKVCLFSNLVGIISSILIVKLFL